MKMYRDKLIEAIVFFANKLRHPSKMMIYKVLAELDFRHYQETGIPVTGLIYEALKKGPVPKKLHREITQQKDTVLPDDIANAISLDKEEWTKDNGERGVTINFKPRRKPNLTLFTPRQQRILGEVADIYRDASATDSSRVKVGKPLYPNGSLAPLYGNGGGGARGLP